MLVSKSVQAVSQTYRCMSELLNLIVGVVQTLEK